MKRKKISQLTYSLMENTTKNEKLKKSCKSEKLPWHHNIELVVVFLSYCLFVFLSLSIFVFLLLSFENGWKDLLTWTWKRVRESSSMSTFKIREISYAPKDVSEKIFPKIKYAKKISTLKIRKVQWNIQKVKSTLTPRSFPFAAALLGVVGGVLLRAPSRAPSPTWVVSWVVITRLSGFSTVVL